MVDRISPTVRTWIAIAALVAAPLAVPLLTIIIYREHDPNDAFNSPTVEPIIAVVLAALGVFVLPIRSVAIQFILAIVYIIFAIVLGFGISLALACLIFRECL